MGWVWFVVVVFVLWLITGLRIVQQYERGVVFRLGRVIGERQPGLRLIIPIIDQLKKVNLRVIAMPIPLQQVITKDNVSMNVAAVAYYQVSDATKSLVAVDNAQSAINQIAQTTVRNIVGQHSLDEILSSTAEINTKVKTILDDSTEPWGIMVSRVELKDIQLPDSMQRAIARQAEAERDKRAKIIAAEGEFQSADKLAQAADIITAHPVALQLRNLQVLTEISSEKNSTIIFPAQFMDTVKNMQAFVDSETAKK